MMESRETEKIRNIFLCQLRDHLSQTRLGVHLKDNKDLVCEREKGEWGWGWWRHVEEMKSKEMKEKHMISPETM